MTAVFAGDGPGMRWAAPACLSAPPGQPSTTLC